MKIDKQITTDYNVVNMLRTNCQFSRLANSSALIINLQFAGDFENRAALIIKQFLAQIVNQTDNSRNAIFKY